jgi:uncharacterized protein (TIGR02246 family)
MRTIECLCRFVVIALVFSFCAIPVSAASDPDVNTPVAAIDGLRQEFNRAYSDANAADLADLLTEDAVWMPPGEPAVVGRNAIQARYAAQFAATHSSFTLKPGDIRVSGDMACLRGAYERIDTPVEGGLAKTIAGKYLMLFSREGGDWKITTDCWNADGASPQVDAQVALHSFRALAEWKLSDVGRMLSLLASTDQAKSGNWDTMEGLLKSLGDTDIPANAIWFVRPDGFYYTVEKGYTGLNLSQRSYFPGLMAGNNVLGTLVVSLSTGKRSVIIAEPVTGDQGLVGGLGVSYSVDQFSLEIDQQMQLPAGAVFYALDSNGQTALHRDPALMFEYPSDMGDESLRTAVAEMLSKDSGTVTYVFRDMRKTIVFEKSAILGWVFALGFSEPLPAPTP